MTRDVNKTALKRTWPRRIIRVLLWTVVVFFLLVIIIVAGLLLYLTPARIESIAEKKTAGILQQELSFTNAHFSIFNGFVFEDIVLSPPDSTNPAPMLPIHSATAKELSLRYSLRHILKRQLLISSVVIDSPQVHVVMKPAAVYTQNAAPLDTTQVKAFRPVEQSAIPESFLAVKLEKFRLKNATITVDRLDSLQQQHIYLSDLSMQLDDVSAPRGDIIAQDSLLRASFSLECRHSECIFDQKTPIQKLHFASELDAKLDVLVSGLSSIQLDGFGELNNIFVDVDDQFSLSPKDFSSPLRAEFGGQINAKEGTAHIEPVAFKVDGVPWIALSVDADSLLTAPFIHVLIGPSEIPIQQLINIAQPFVPKEVMPSIYLHNSKSHLTLEGTTISGTIPDTSGGMLDCRLIVALKDFGATLNTNEQFLKNFDFNAEISALVGIAGVQKPTATVSVSYDSVFITTGDGQKVFSGHAGFTAETELNAAFFPTRVKGELSMSNVLGSDIHGDLALTSNGKLENLRGAGGFHLKNIDISPFTKSQILSLVSADANLTLNSFDDISVKASVSTDSITMVQEFDNIVFSPVTLDATFKGTTDTLFQNFAVRSLTAKVNDIVSAELTGTGSLAAQTQIDLNHLFVSCDLAAAFAWVPEKLKAPLGDTEVTGLVTLTSQFHGKMSEADTTFNGRLFVKTNDVNVNYQNGLAILSDIGLDVNGKISSLDSASLAIGLGIAQAETNTLADKVFRDNNVRIELSMPNFSTVKIDTGFIQLPDLKTSGTIGGLVELVDNVPIINAKVKLTQNAADTIRLLPDIYYRGRNDIELTMKADSTRAAVSASIRTTDLTVSLPQDIRVEKINANISLAQLIDLKNGTIIISPEAIVNTPSDGLIDYRLYRDYYYQPDKNPSFVTIRRAVVGDYLVENIRAEAYIGAGTVEIPMFTLEAYGGNIGGSFSLIGNTENILESSYKLSAHMSGINSSLLLPSLQGKSQGTLKAHTELVGKGFDIIHGFDLDGYFNITEIESKVASNLLSILDPEGKDTAIKFTKLVMNYGYKPSLLTFDIGHGYCYPAIYFSQPWYNPIRLSGGSIEFARIPIASLLTMNQ